MTPILKSAIKITIIYTVVGFLWIYTSDHLLYFITNDAEKVTQLQTYKGWFYVLFTAILLFLLIKRELSKQHKTLRLLNSQDLLANQVIKNIPDIDVYIIDDKMNFLLAQGTEMKKHGLTPSNVLGKNFKDINIDKKIKSYLKPMYQEVLNGNNLIEQFELNNEWIEIRGVPLFDNNHEKLGGLIVAINITKEKKTLQNITEQRNEYEALYEEYLSTNEELQLNNEKLIESERRLETLIHNMASVAYRSKIDEHWTMTFMSDYVENLSGYKPHEIINNNIISFNEITHHEDREYVNHEIHQAIEHNKSFVIEYRIQTKDGVTKWVWEQGIGVKDKSGHPICVEGVMIDITELKTSKIELQDKNEKLNHVNIELEENLEKLQRYYNELEDTRKKVADSEFKYRTLFDNLNDAVFVHNIQPDDKPGLIIETNGAACSMLGYTKNELLQLTVLDISPDEVEEISPTITHNIRSNSHYIFEIQFKAKNNTHIDVEVSSHYFELRGEGLVISICRDIRERKAKEAELVKQKEKAEESDKLKSAFLANISHEIRTPMNGILGFSSLLGHDDITPQQREKYTKIIKNSSDQLLRIINDLLDISRIETNQLEINESEFSLELLMEEINILLEEQIKNKQKDIKTAVNISIDPSDTSILGDKERIYQILLNLVTNAEKFTENGFIEIGCTKENQAIHFWVKDTGIGISENMQSVIFERFRQDEIVSTKALGGNGLGLPICKGLVHLLGGEIYVESALEKGSTFHFTIPYKIKTNKESANTSMVNTSNIHDKTILVAEDVDESYELLLEYLKEYQVHVMRTINGKETIELFNNNPQIDLILMDIRMPDMNGHEATKAIRKKNTTIPIIAQTAYAMTNDKQIILDSGCTDYISKPINQEKLKNILHKYL